MQYNSRTEIISTVMLSNESSRLINIIAPPLSGKSQLIEEIVYIIQNKPKSIALNIKIQEVLNFEILSLFRKEFKDEYDLDLIVPEKGILLSESLYFLLSQIKNKTVNNIYLLIDDINESGLQVAYNILSQLRNLREKLTAKPLQINFCTVCIGVWKPNELQDICNNKFGSSFPLELFLCDYSFNEVKEVLINLPNTISLDYNSDYKINYLLELSGGCFTIIDYILKNSKDNFNCETIRDMAYELTKKEFFLEYIEKSLTELSELSKEVILKTLKNRIVKYDNNKITDELIISGLMKKKDLNGVPVLVMRSWIHEITIRSKDKLRKIIGSESIYCDIKEIIPPTPSLNKMAYEIVLEIENRLRNFVVVFLAGIKNDYSHPLMIADDLGKMRDDWKNPTLYEELVFQRKKCKDLYSDFIDAYSSVSSYITVVDLTNLILNDNENKGLNKYFDSVFINNDENKKMFEKFRIIRNQIAHNNIITEKTIDELIEIDKSITHKLITKM